MEEELKNKRGMINYGTALGQGTSAKGGEGRDSEGETKPILKIRGEKWRRKRQNV